MAIFLALLIICQAMLPIGTAPFLKTVSAASASESNSALTNAKNAKISDERGFDEHLATTEDTLQDIEPADRQEAKTPEQAAQEAGDEPEPEKDPAVVSGALAPEFVSAPGQPGEIIVCFKDQPAGLMAMQALEEAGACQAAETAAKSRIRLVQVTPEADLDETLAHLRQEPGVEYAEPNYELYAQAELPNAPRYGEQWALKEIEALDAWEEAINILQGASPVEVLVAVIDTCVDAAHEDLESRMLPGRNVINSSTDTDDNAVNGHGTHVAGIIAAEANNDKGIAGVAGELPVLILPVKALDAAGVGTMYDVAQGIHWAVDQGARVINLSLGTRLPDYPRTLAEAVKYAQDRGVLVVAGSTTFFRSRFHCLN